MNKRAILLLLLAIALIGGFIGYRMYNAETPKAADVSADVTVDAETLFQAFVKDEAAAGKVYNDKVVQVKGTVRDVSTTPGGPTNVMLETSDAMASVMCEFPTGGIPAAVAKGRPVTIKGFCAGYNMDVQLQRCSVVE